MVWTVSYGSDIAVLSMKAENRRDAAIKACHLIDEGKSDVCVISPEGEKFTNGKELRFFAKDN